MVRRVAQSVDLRPNVFCGILARILGCLTDFGIPTDNRIDGISVMQAEKLGCRRSFALWHVFPLRESIDGIFSGAASFRSYSRQHLHEQHAPGGRILGHRQPQTPKDRLGKMPLPAEAVRGGPRAAPKAKQFVVHTLWEASWTVRHITPFS
jgi:hypothetical protein